MLKVSFRQVIDMSTLDKMIELVNFKALPVEQLPYAYLTKYLIVMLIITMAKYLTW